MYCSKGGHGWWRDQRRHMIVWPTVSIRCLHGNWYVRSYRRIQLYFRWAQRHWVVGSRKTGSAIGLGPWHVHTDTVYIENVVLSHPICIHKKLLLYTPGLIEIYITSVLISHDSLETDADRMLNRCAVGVFNKTTQRLIEFLRSHV